MLGLDVLWMHESGSGDQFGERVQRAVMKLVHALGFGRHHECALTQHVLSGHACRAGAGVTALRLNAAEREHEAARRIAPVRAHRHRLCDVERSDDFAARADLDAVAKSDAYERVVHQHEPFAQRHAHVIGELHGGCAGAAFRAIDDNEIGRDAGLHHRFGNGKKFPRMTNRELHARRFAAGEFAHFGDEFEHLDGRGKHAVLGGRNAVNANRNAARFGDFRRDFRAGQDAAVTRLCALRQF